MEKFDRVPIYGDVPSLETACIEVVQNPPDLLLRSIVPYRRFAIRAADNGMDSFGLREGCYAVFREERYPTRECSVCLVRFGKEVTIRLLEGINATLVTLRVAGDKIPPLELADTDFTIVGVLDGVVLEKFAQLEQREIEETLWGC